MRALMQRFTDRPYALRRKYKIEAASRGINAYGYVLQVNVCLVIKKISYVYLLLKR